MTTYLKELDESGLNMEVAIEKLRDEVAAVMLEKHRGHSRHLSMVIAKLDEARLWAVSYGECNGTHVVIDKRKLVKEHAS